MFVRQVLVLYALCSLTNLAAAQGITSYLNFEAPTHKPILVAQVGFESYLLVCNAADQSVEVYTTSDHRFLVRVPVGAEPISIVAKPTPVQSGGRRFYVANWLGDSVTAFELTPRSTQFGALDARVLQTVPVGDEPTMMAFLPENPGDPATLPGGVWHESLLVTFSAQAAWGWFDADALQPIAAGYQHREVLAHDGTRAVKDPRAIAFSPATAEAPNVANRLFILNFRGGGDLSTYDLDLWSADDVAAAASTQQADRPEEIGIGSTNFNMSFAPNGDLYVASVHARNQDPALAPDPITAVGEPIHRHMVTHETGFATSRLVRVRGAGEASSERLVLDLNLEQGAQSAIAVTQPTDVVVYGSGKDDETRVFVTGFSSDALAMVAPTAGQMLVTRIDLAHPANAFTRANLGGIMRGPRALALKQAGPASDPSDRLYVYNRIEQSITVIDPNFLASDPATAIITSFALQHDPTPAHVKDGRKFLYSAKLSGGGNVSCSSCHIDGNSDFLAWNLSDGGAVPLPGQGLVGALGPNAAVKGPMTTQSLRGLVNFEILDGADQDQFFSNRPYHWRGDKGAFTDFNAAFVNLMAIDPPEFLDPQSGARNKGIPDAEMKLFARFVNSIHYPPNPEQPLERRYSGDIGGGANAANDENAGSGAQRGLKIFHIGSQSMGPRTCVVCHALPVGTNSIFTGTFFYFGSNLDAQSIETAQLRGMVLKESVLMRTASDGTLGLIPDGSPGAMTQEFGLVHTGKTTLIFGQSDQSVLPFGSESILSFTTGFGMSSSQSNDVARYVREFDSGVAPMVGRSTTVDAQRLSADPGAVLAAIDQMEAQAHAANASIAVYARLDQIERGYWYDVTDPLAPYVEQAHGGLSTIGPFSRDQLLALVDAATSSSPDNLLIWSATALGSERRVAYLDGGVPPASASSPPTNIHLLGCRTNTANRAVPSMTKNVLEPLISGLFSAVPTNKTLVWFEASLMLHAKTATPQGFGVMALRHEAPRRLRVSGDGIRPGAWLKLYAPKFADILTATKTTPPTTTPSNATHTLAFELPLFPARDGAQGLVWETAAEFEPRHLLGMLNGGPRNAVVDLALKLPNHPGFLQIGATDLMQPMLWNWWWVEVQNDPADAATFAGGGWQRLFVD